jgi:urease accessory protein
LTNAQLPLRPRLQRSNGACRATFVATEAGARLGRLYQSDPCRLFLPPGSTDDLPCALLLTTSGGIAGGDRLAVSLAWLNHARASVTTGAAEKIYRAGDSGPAEIETEISVADGAYAEWLPQETILFRQAALSRRCRINLVGDGRLLAADMVVLGRAAAGEKFTDGYLHDQWQIRRDGRLVFFDSLLLDGQDGGALDHPHGMAGAGAFGFMVLAAPEAASLIEQARSFLPLNHGLSGVTMINDILLVRWLAEDGARLRVWVGAMIAGLRSAFGLPDRCPRIWS